LVPLFLPLRVETAAGCPAPGFVTRWLSNRRRVLRHNETMNEAFETASRILWLRGVRPSVLLAAVLALGATGAQAAQETNVYYRCPNNVFTNTITAKEADARGCKAMEAQQPTTIPAPRMRPAVAATPGTSASKVDAQEQKQRDTDARKILQDELIKAQTSLDALQKEYNNGQPERKGDEKNYQKYIDRTNDLKAQITRAESDIGAITRELAKTP
jgi:hypothetical protein